MYGRLARNLGDRQCSLGRGAALFSAGSRRHSAPGCFFSRFLRKPLRPTAILGKRSDTDDDRPSVSSRMNKNNDRTLVTATSSQSLFLGTPLLFQQLTQPRPRQLPQYQQNQLTVRSLAFVTGHKKTKRVNKKKRSAKLRKQNKKSKKKSGAIQQERKPTKKQLLAERVDRIARSPDYPVPRQYQEQQNFDNDNHEIINDTTGRKFVPPPVMVSTASAHVFVAKIACEETDLEPHALYAGIDERRPLPGTFVEFLKPSFGSSDNYPPTMGQPEVAFLGRSNVGKSSLINAMMRRTLAVTSKTPGRTQSEYYYGFVPGNAAPDRARHGKKGYAPQQATGFLIDLPGYGFAAAPDEAVSNWQQATQDFLLRRRDAGTLRRVVLLQDARLQVPQNLDAHVADWMERAEIPYSIVLTKADTVTADGKRTAGLIKHANLVSMRFLHLYTLLPDGGTVYMSPFVHATSSRKNTGVAELVAHVFAEFQPPEQSQQPQQAASQLSNDDDEYDEVFDSEDEYDSDDEDEEDHDYSDEEEGKEDVQDESENKPER